MPAPRARVCLLLPVLLAGCMAETVRKAPPRRGPVQEVGYIDTGGGEVRYSLEGWSWFVAGRRRDALRRMRRVCRKLKAVVSEEFAREDADVPYSQDDIDATLDRGLDHFTVAPYMHLTFDCVDEAAPPGPSPAVSSSTVPTSAPSQEAVP